MYHVRSKPFGKATLISVENHDRSDYFEIVNTGATIHGLQLNGTALITGAPTPAQFRESSGLFEGSKLCPFPGRIPGGKYSFSGVSYQLEQNDQWGPNAIHGLLTNSQFDITREHCTAEHGSISLRHQFQPIHGYPFSFNIEIEFELSNKGFSIQTNIRNSGVIVLPIGDGWHPYFSLGGTIDEYEISLPPSKRLILEHQIPTGSEEDHPYFGFRLGNKELDDVFVIEEGVDIAMLAIRHHHKKLTVWQHSGESGYRYLVIYTPGSRDKLAIEPLSCAPNAFNNALGLKKLGPGEDWSLKFGVMLEIDS